MTVADFLASADAAAPHLAESGSAVGRPHPGRRRRPRAPPAGRTPISASCSCARRSRRPRRPAASLRASFARVLSRLDRRDAVLAYRAIRLASPGGLGRSDRHDVAEEPTVTLLEAMREAAGRDRIAMQYVSGFRGRVRIGVARLRACRAAGWADHWALSATFLALLAAFPTPTSCASMATRWRERLLCEGDRARSSDEGGGESRGPWRIACCSWTGSSRTAGSILEPAPT